MGLDQYAYATSIIPDKPVDFEYPEERVEIHYWRKHPNLQGWMEQLYYKRGGSGQDTIFGKSFNSGCPVALTLEDLDNLENDLLNKQLPETTGFFFGTSSPGQLKDDLQFIQKARAAIQSGKCVFYDSWW